MRVVENGGPGKWRIYADLNFTDWKMQDWKLTDRVMTFWMTFVVAELNAGHMVGFLPFVS